jgi:hypothetical protein
MSKPAVQELYDLYNAKERSCDGASLDGLLAIWEAGFRAGSVREPYIWVIMKDGVVQGSYRERPNDVAVANYEADGMTVERWLRRVW